MTRVRNLLLISTLLFVATPASASIVEPIPDPVIAAGGDVACDPADVNFENGAGTPQFCAQMRTSDLLVGSDYAAVLALGDLQYENGALAKFNASYDPSWGRVKGITYPAVGNHEYQTPQAQGYLDYFGAGAADPESHGFYYSFDLGEWHLIALNSNCTKLNEVVNGQTVNGCATKSDQMRWLRQDLAANPAQCTLAFWHHPRFSSVQIKRPMAIAWKILYRNRAELILNGHMHHYERFAKNKPDGTLDQDAGIRQITVGTGGKSHKNPLTGDPKWNSQAFNVDTYGVLELTLHSTSYDWNFKAEAQAPLQGDGQPFSDVGTTDCS